MMSRCANVLFLSLGGREADFGSIGRGMLRGRSREAMRRG